MTNLDLPPQTEKALEEAKKLGFSKAGFVEKAVRVNSYLFLSTEDWPTTVEQVGILQNLRALREKLVRQGADHAVIDGYDLAIKHQEGVLKQLEKGEFKKNGEP